MELLGLIIRLRVIVHAARDRMILDFDFLVLFVIDDTGFEGILQPTNDFVP